MIRVSHRRRGLQQTDWSQRDGGYVLAKFALLLVPLLLMSGFSVDVGYWYNRAADIQKAADAAALAGVVWLPDEDKAEEYAIRAATANGFTTGDNIRVTVVKAGDRRLRVTITDNRVGSFFFRNLGGRSINLTRTGLAEYVLPVPLGSPRNYFGTGTLLPDGQKEFLYQSVNAACTSKVNGDRYQSLHFNPLAVVNGNTQSYLSRCDDLPTNGEHRARGYELYVEAPAGRSDSIEVLLFDPRYSEAGITYTVPDGETCVTNTDYNPTTYTPPSSWTPGPGNANPVILVGPAQYQTRPRASGSGSNTWSGTTTLAWGEHREVDGNLVRYRVATTWSPGPVTWTGPHTSQSSTQITVTGPAVYQLRNDYRDTTFDPPIYLERNETRTIRRDRIRYRTTTTLPTYQSCTPRTREVTDPGIDNYLNFTGEENFTFSLRSENGTPLTDDDDIPVPGCTKEYSRSSPFEREFLGSKRWNVLCTIPPSDEAARYILRVENDGADSSLGDDGSNQWGLVARYASASGPDLASLCDGRTDDLCPRVYGRDAISVYANSRGATADFFLAEIEPEHTGKTLELELWDPGEGGETISILRPTGTDTWEKVPITWASFEDDNSPVTSGSGVDISLRDSNGDRFNGRLLRIQIALDDYAPPADNRWWKISYKFATGRDVTDRTTWSARVIGDPVHLLEEEAP